MTWLAIKSKIPWDWRNGAMGAGGAILLGFVLLLPGVGDRFSEWSFDFPFRFRGDPKPEDSAVADEAVIVYMDAKSAEALHQPYKHEAWDRRVHAQLTTNLTKFGAKVIAFDILWTTSATGDVELAQAMKAHGKVVVASSSQSEEGRQLLEGDERRPIDLIRSNSNYGIVEFPVGSDRVIRRQLSHRDYTNMSWKAAELIDRAPPDRKQRRWLNFYGPPKSLPSYSYRQLFDSASIPAQVFSNKVVFVGMESTITSGGTTVGDEWATPYTAWTRGELSPGVEFQATAFLNLVRNEWLNELSQWAEIGIICFVGIVGGFGLILLRPWIAAAVSVVAFIALAGWAVLLWRHHSWFPWLVPGAVQIPVVLSWAVLVNTRKVYREKEVLEHTVATEKARAASASAQHQTGSGPVGVLSAINEAARIAKADEPTVITPDAAVTRLATHTIGDHELIRSIGKGAYGEVWLGRSLVGIYRAVKVVYRKSFEHDAPFEREFRGLKKFAPVSASHPGFVHILHVGKDDVEGHFYYIMELGDDEVSGQKFDPETYSARNLGKELRKRGNLPVAECASVGIELAGALNCLHEHELIHRDIKPSNIIFMKGVAKLADIGLVTEIKTVASDATYVGTPGYIAPEGPGSKVADVFSLGKVLYECAMGRSSDQYPELPSSLLERTETEALLELNKIITRACDPDPKARYPTAADLETELVKFQSRFKTETSRVE